LTFDPKYAILYSGGRMKIIEYIRWVRELEKILALPSKPFLPALKPGWEGRWYWVPLRFPKVGALELAIHEMRHRLQDEMKVTPISLEKIEYLLPPEEIGLLKSAASVSPREEDAEIAERIGARLVRKGRIREFRELMLSSLLPKL
jgi:hypothetical protein